METTFSESEIRRYYENRLSKLKQLGKELRGPCPLHAGRRDSFAVNLETGQWFCHSTCKRGGTLIHLEMELKNLPFRDARRSVFELLGRALPAKTKVKITGTYVYQNEHGEALSRVLRFESSRGKTFSQEHPDTHAGWVKGMDGIRRVPFHLPEVLRSDRVCIVEGEKKVEALRAWGLTATCNSGGAGKWLLEFSPHFENRNVVILPDNDEPGRRHAVAVAENLLPVAKSVRIVELPGLPQKGDVLDWQVLGGTQEKLEALISEATPLDAHGLADWRRRFFPNESPSPVKGASDVVGSHFHVKDDGVFFADPNGDNEPVRICSRLDIAAETRNDQGEGWGRLLKWKDREGREHFWAMPMSLLAGSGDEYRSRLLDGGLQIQPGKHVRELLSRFVQSATCERRVRCVSKLGWHGEVFVLPESTIGATANGEGLVFQSPFESQHFFNCSGSLEEWKQNVGQLCSGNSRLVFVVSCGFAAPLLAFSKDECGGFHLYGPSSTGKTTALLIAGSVWGGGGRNGFVESWRSTINGLEAFGELHNDALGCLDEISQLDAREATECLYLLANGQGKGRMTKTLGLRQRLAWTTSVLSSGEITLAEHSESIGKRTRAGAEIRLVNLPVDASAGMGIFENLHSFENSEALSRHLRDASKAYYGQPIRRFLECIVANRPGVEQRIRDFRASFLSGCLPSSAYGEVIRAGGRFALAGIAGELATEFGITGWQQGEAKKAAARCLEDWLCLRETFGASDIERAVRQVKAFLEAHGGSRFQAIPRRGFLAEGSPEHVHNRAGFKREDEDGTTRFFILSEIFRTEVCRGFDHRAVAHALADRGWLESSSGRNQVKVRVPELGPTWVYAVKSSIME
jgi:putative DNA primase/helicase